jgi:hypothetical protein
MARVFHIQEDAFNFRVTRFLLLGCVNNVEFLSAVPLGNASAKERLITSAGYHEKYSVSEPIGSYSKLFKVIGELLEHAFTTAACGKFVLRNDPGVTGFSLHGADRMGSGFPARLFAIVP